MIGPAIDDPVDVLLDGLDIFDVFARGVGVVHAEVAGAIELAGDAEIQANGFGVADVQVAVGLRRKAGDDFRIFFGRHMFGDDVADKIAGLRCCRRFWWISVFLRHA